MTPPKGPNSKDAVNMEARLSALESHVERFAQFELDIRAAVSRIESSNRQALDNIGARIERVLVVETEQRGLKGDIDRAFETMRRFDSVMQANTLTMGQISTSLASLPRIENAMNGETGLVARMAVAMEKIDKHDKYGAELKQIEAILDGDDGLVSRLAKAATVVESHRWALRMAAGGILSAMLGAMGSVGAVVYLLIKLTGGQHP